MTDIRKAAPDDAGCWVDGHWGQYGSARVVELAKDYGYSDREVIAAAEKHLATMGPNAANNPELTDGEWDILLDGDPVENWLNENVAPEGYLFGWNDGEFFLQSTAWWEEE